MATILKLADSKMYFVIDVHCFVSFIEICLRYFANMLTLTDTGSLHYHLPLPAAGDKYIYGSDKGAKTICSGTYLMEEQKY